MQKTTQLFVLILCLLVTGSVFAQDKTKLSVPSEAEQSEAKKLVMGLYEDSLDGDDQVAVIKDILKTASETKDAPGKYALLKLAIDQCVQTGDAELYLEIVQAIESAFNGAELLWVDQFSDLTRKTPKGKANEAHGVYGKLIDLCMKKNDFANAQKIARAGTVFARRHRSISKDAVERLKLVRIAEREYKKVEPALATLEKDPTNAQANTVVGKYKCFVQGDWKAGLGHLVLSDDKELSALAETELLAPPKAEDQVALADAWVKLAKREKLYEENIKAHAAKWYQKALPNLTGLQAKRVEKFLENNKQGGTESIKGSKLKSVMSQLDLTGASAKFENGILVITEPKHKRYVNTKSTLKSPIHIRYTVSTDSTNIRLRYGIGLIIFNWEGRQTELRVHDFKTKSHEGIPGKGQVEINKFHVIDVIIKDDMYKIYVNKELRYEKQGNFKGIDAVVGIGASWGSTLKVKDIQIGKP